jgi:hypothetical protein
MGEQPFFFLWWWCYLRYNGGGWNTFPSKVVAAKRKYLPNILATTRLVLKPPSSTKCECPRSSLLPPCSCGLAAADLGALWLPTTITFLSRPHSTTVRSPPDRHLGTTMSDRLCSFVRLHLYPRRSGYGRLASVSSLCPDA